MGDYDDFNMTVAASGEPVCGICHARGGNGDLPGGFRWMPCAASEQFEFTTHVLPPRGVMHYCQSLYGASPTADILMIQGYDWGLRNGISDAALANLEHALAFFRSTVLNQ